MYGNNPYLASYSPQANIDRINTQIAELEKMRSQIPQQIQAQQPTNLTQNFQLAPNSHDVIKYASSIDEVQREMVVGDTPYFSKDMSVVWIKNTKGEIKAYELTEIIERDEKDLQIEYLTSQINELKGMIANAGTISNANATEVQSNTSTDVGTVGSTTKKSKSSSVSKISRSKKE